MAASAEGISSPEEQSIRLWDLPDAVLFHVVSFVAAPTRRASVLCHQIAPLCKGSCRAILEEERSVALWDTVLKEDYGVSDGTHDKRRKRRSCKRLRRSPVHRVRDAHLLIKDNTEIAFFYLSEMVNTSKKDKLTKSKMVRLLDEYGPHLRINNVVSSGGLYLVEACRARHVKESVVLKCVQELVEERGAMLDLLTSESPGSSLTALCVAAARGMPSVVKYLLQKGASREVRSSGRFRLHTQPKKSLRCSKATPIEFAQAMRDAEKEAGASDRDLSDLSECIRLLEEA